MAVRVLLEFDDEDMARAFVQGCVRSSSSSESMMRVHGVYKKPTVFCECVGGKKTSTAFTRGRKYGWWVCAQCAKPTKKWALGNAWYTTLGANLLPRDLRPYEEAMPLSLESPVVWSDVVSSMEA